MREFVEFHRRLRKAVRERRKELDWSMADASKRAGMSPDQWWYLEHDGSPSLRNLLQACKALGVPVTDLIGEASGTV